MRISIVVPVRNEEASIRELLDSLLSQTRLPDEIVITDGGSTDRTTQIIEEYTQKAAMVRLIRTAGALPGRGRNLAARSARFEWLGFIDGGIRPAKNWLEALAMRAEQDESTDVVYGSWEPVTDTFFKECAAIAYVPPPIEQGGFRIRPRFIASSLIRREAWRAVEGFPENLRSGEDLIFMNRVEAAGFRFVFEPLAVVYWSLRPTFGATFARFVVYSRNNIRAGLWRQWQAAILTRYFLLVALTLPALLLGPFWLWLPFLCWILMLLARGLTALRRNRFCYPARTGRNLKRLIVLAPLIATLDAAAIVGTVQWLVMDSYRWSNKAVAEAGDGA